MLLWMYSFKLHSFKLYSFKLYFSKLYYFELYFCKVCLAYASSKCCAFICIGMTAHNKNDKIAQLFHFIILKCAQLL